MASDRRRTPAARPVGASESRFLAPGVDRDGIDPALPLPSASTVSSHDTACDPIAHFLIARTPAEAEHAVADMVVAAAGRGDFEAASELVQMLMVLRYLSGGRCDG